MHQKPLMTTPYAQDSFSKSNGLPPVVIKCMGGKLRSGFYDCDAEINNGGVFRDFTRLKQNKPPQ